MVAEILGPRVRLAHNRAGANLVSGVTSALLAHPDAELGLFEVDEGAFPDVARRVGPQAVLLGNLFRDQLDRYGELELIAERWRESVRALPERRLGRGERRRPARGGHRAGTRDDVPLRARRSEGRARTPPPRRRLEVLQCLRQPVRLRGGLRRPPRRLVVPVVRARAADARRHRARDRARGPRARGLRPRDAAGNEAHRPRPPRSLQRLQRDCRGLPLARPGRDARRGRGRHRALSAGVRALRAHPGGRPDGAAPARQEPGGRQRGRAHAHRRRAAARRRRRAQRRHRRRQGRLLDLGRRLRAAPRRPGAASSPRARGRRSSRSASSTAGSTRTRSRSCRASSGRSTAGWS